MGVRPASYIDRDIQCSLLLYTIGIYTHIIQSTSRLNGISATHKNCSIIRLKLMYSYMITTLEGLYNKKYIGILILYLKYSNVCWQQSTAYRISKGQVTNTCICRIPSQLKRNRVVQLKHCIFLACEVTVIFLVCKV